MRIACMEDINMIIRAESSKTELPKLLHVSMNV